jgi:hypothetical protein
MSWKMLRYCGGREIDSTVSFCREVAGLVLQKVKGGLGVLDFLWLDGELLDACWNARLFQVERTRMCRW